MFRLPVLTKECASTLAAFGPDLENLADCSNNPLKPNFNMLFNDSVYNLNTSLNCNLDWTHMLKQSYEVIKPLQVIKQHIQIYINNRFIVILFKCIYYLNS